MNEFKDILELRNFLHGTDRRSYLSGLWSQLYPGWYVWVTSSRAQGNSGKIVPVDLGAYLYRGQIEIHSPCLPSIFRNNNSPYDELATLLKLSEFRLLCLSHPGVRRCIEFGLDIDFVGLAQHYGLDTNYLDFTQEADIACFFAVCRLNSAGRYVPYKGKGLGCIYRISHTNPELRKRAVLIGKQPFSRPGVQKAWALEMRRGEDLEALPGVEAFAFHHSGEASEIVWQLFDDSLYPYDIMENKANELKISPTIYKSVFNRPFERFLQKYSTGAISVDDFYALINNQRKYVFSDKPSTAFSPAELRDLSSRWEKYGDAFLRKVGALFASKSL